MGPNCWFDHEIKENIYHCMFDIGIFSKYN